MGRDLCIMFNFVIISIFRGNRTKKGVVQSLLEKGESS